MKLCQFKKGNNPCSIETCLNSGSCYEDTFGSLNCFCKEGFTGTKCEIDNSKI